MKLRNKPYFRSESSWLFRKTMSNIVGEVNQFFVSAFATKEITQEIRRHISENSSNEYVSTVTIICSDSINWMKNSRSGRSVVIRLIP